MLEIRLLGRFEIRKDGEPIEISSRKAQSLLAYLLLNSGMHHRREKIAGLLWPDTDEIDARSKLRYALWQLRKALGKHFIQANKITLTFDQQSDYWLDTANLAKRHPERLDTEELRQIISLYEGELLPGFYEDWVTLERDRLHASFEKMIELLVYRLIKEKRWQEALDWGEHWISFGTASEPAFRALMISHNQLGDSSNAAIAYRRCVQTLQEQLEVEPSEETKKIYGIITQGEKLDDLLLNINGAGRRPHPATQRLPTFLELKEEEPEHLKNIFVARENELDQLNNALKLALVGQGRVIFVRGDAGRGKTALLHEFSRYALCQDDKLVVTFGFGESQFGRGDPHLPFRDILAMLTGEVEQSWANGVISREGARRLWNLIPQSTQTLIELGPDLIDSFISGESLLARASLFAPQGNGWLEQIETLVSLRRSRPIPLNIQHSDLQKDLFEQYTKVLQEISRHRPLVVILDDLQWADLGSISLLFHLGRRIQGYRILIVGDYRPDEVMQSGSGKQHPLARILTEFKRNFGEFEIDLDHVDESEGRRFIDAFLDTEPNRLAEDFRSALFQHTGGHPLFTIELLRQMQEQGKLQKDDQGLWYQGPALSWDTLPARVEAVIAGRINRLSTNLREILSVASVEGEEFTAEVIAHVENGDESMIVHKLSAELDKQHLLVEAGGIQRVAQQRLSRYRFQHNLFHKYVYNSLDEVERVHIHEKVGQALETLYQDKTERVALQLARHFEEAGMAEKTITYLLQAGEFAKRQSANEEAITHLTRGLQLLKHLPEGHDRVRTELALQIALSAPLVATKGYTAIDAEQTIERARELCEQIDEIPQLATVLWGLWSFYLVRAKHATARELAEQIFALARINEESNLTLMAHWTLGITLFHLGNFIQARKHLNQAIELYDSEYHSKSTYLYGQNPAVTCLIYSAYTLWFLGYPDQALERSQLALSLAEKIAHPYSQSFAHSMAAIFHAVRRDAEAALQHSEEAIRLSKQAGFPFLLALGLTMRGWARAKLGKSSMTTRQILRGIDAMDIIGAELGRPILLFFLVEAYQIDKQIDEGLEVLEDAFHISDKNKEHMSDSELYRLKGELLEIQGKEQADIIACFQKAIEIARQQNAKMLELRGLMCMDRILQKTNQHALIREELVTVHKWFKEGFDTPDLRESQNLLKLS